MKTTEEKAKAYDEAIERAKKWYNAPNSDKMPTYANRVIEEIFPELCEPDDDGIRKALLRWVQSNSYTSIAGVPIKNVIAWLEKQGEKLPVGFYYVNSEGKKFYSDTFKYGDVTLHVEKPDKQEQLYIRFGEIPTDEKSKIYQGEIEVGTENGVSVYPAFKTDKGDIVLGLNLPITKTTLYTQQHLLEYDNRPCYLIKGDYVGKDTDGQPLINNVSIIKKIDNYRVKEKKQDEQKSVDNISTKFKVGDWLISNNKKSIYQVTEVKRGIYVVRDNADNQEYHIGIEECEKSGRLWNISDAKDGDVLAEDTCIFIIKKLNNDLSAEIYCCLYDDGDFDINSKLVFDDTCTYPATKEQCDTLFAKIKESGYEWDSEKKELKKIEEKSAEWSKEDDNCLSTIISEFSKCSEKSVSKDEWMRCNDFLHSIKDRIKPKHEWSKEDETMLESIISDFAGAHKSSIGQDKWLKSLKDRVKSQPTWKPSNDQMYYLSWIANVKLGDGIVEQEVSKHLNSLYDDLKKLKED